MLLRMWFGERDKRLDAEEQDMLQVESRTYDAYAVVLPDGSETRLFFDVTEWLSRISRT